LCICAFIGQRDPFGSTGIASLLIITGSRRKDTLQLQINLRSGKRGSRMSLEPRKAPVLLSHYTLLSETCETGARFPPVAKADKASMRGKAKRLTRRHAYL